MLYPAKNCQNDEFGLDVFPGREVTPSASFRVARTLLCKIAHSSVFSFHSTQAACLSAHWSALSHGDEHVLQQATRGPDRESPSVVVPFRLIDAFFPAPCFFRRLKRLHPDLTPSSVLASSSVLN